MEARLEERATLAQGTFRPDPDQAALWPEISGNRINGLGEPDRRRPSHVYWHDPEKIAHGSLQGWFYSRQIHPDLVKVRDWRQKIIDAPLPEMAGDRARATPEEFAAGVKAATLAASAEDVGIVALDQSWIYDDSEADLPWVVVFAVAHDYENLKQAPRLPGAIEVITQYGRALKVAKDMAGWILNKGYRVELCAGPMAGRMTLIPPALAAGLGELGKHGSMINRKFGSNFRLAAVLTDMPLVADTPDIFGADSFCTNCQVCSKACPPDAIFATKQQVRGTEKWYVDFDKCLPFFNETAGCGLCLAVCPWSRPGVADNLVVKMAKRMAREMARA